MARELVTQKGVGEKADACWREVQREHTRVLEAQRVSVVEQPQDSVPTCGSHRRSSGCTSSLTNELGRLSNWFFRERERCASPTMTATHNSRCRSERHKKTIPKCAERRRVRPLQYGGLATERMVHMENKGPFISELPQTGEVTLLAVVLDKDLRPEAQRRNVPCLALCGPQRRTRRKGLGQPRDGIPVV